MGSGKILTDLTVSVSIWIGIVLVLLSFQADFNDKAIATPISVKVEKLDHSNKIDVPSYKQTASAVPETTNEVHTEIAGILKKGESLDLAMKRLKVSDNLRIDIIQGFRKSLDFRTLLPGDRFSIFLDHNNSIKRVKYESGQLKTHVLERKEDGSYLASRQAIDLEYRIERLAGVINSSVYNAFSKLGETPKLIQAYADIFASKIDFNTETRVGDRFEFLVEKYYKDGIFVGYGKILFARYQKEKVEYEGYYYSSENTPAGYFDQKGEALGTWFIRSPIPFGRVTSRFTMRRKHPVDGVVRPHLGIDLAAPRNTPVMATAEGKIEYVGRKGGFGKTVIIGHHGGYKTYYGHLNGYKKGLRKGSIVQQKDIIGYVGSTGISTGPHLDYRIKHNGVFRNPFGIKFKARTVLKDEELDLFLGSSNRIAELFNTDKDGKVLQVKNITLTEDHSISFL